MIRFLCISILTMLIACTPSTSDRGNAENHSIYQIKVQKVAPNGWGYQILKDDQVFINQPHIPAISGKQTFKTKEKANKTATFVVWKLEQGIIPPTLSLNELDSLGVMD